MLSEKLANDIACRASEKLSIKTAGIKEAVSIDYIIRAFRKELATSGSKDAVLTKYKKLMHKATHNNPIGAEQLDRITRQLSTNASNARGYMPDDFRHPSGSPIKGSFDRLLGGDISKGTQGHAISDYWHPREMLNPEIKYEDDWLFRSKPIKNQAYKLDKANTATLAPSRAKPNWKDFGTLSKSDIDKRMAATTRDMIQPTRDLAAATNKVTSPEFGNSITDHLKGRSMAKKIKNMGLAESTRRQVAYGGR